MFFLADVRLEESFRYAHFAKISRCLAPTISDRSKYLTDAITEMDISMSCRFLGVSHVKVKIN